MISGLQIASLLRLAKEQLAYCKTIINYPKTQKKNKYNYSSDIDRFYNNVACVFFNDSILIISSLLDDKDKRVISFKNFTDFFNKKEIKINILINQFNSSKLKEVRDQIIAHQDINNINNQLPYRNRQGVINPLLLEIVENFLDKAIKEFKEYASECSNPYSEYYFSATEAKKEINAILEKAKPILT
ncbi:hypothetical protein A2335_02550 [Candidatus Peregrinibacteria bacterium RIFOXYB2_FULL_32_7]|nr:MAG: hypothetical protein A2335_02550 [Candidatus Peregrinibacteria bacterium RIFOXYB2_FULL_32_7]